MRYQVGKVLPYWIKTNIFRKKGLEPPRLYQFDRLDDNSHVVRQASKSEA
jgi:hypothetical protein